MIQIPKERVQQFADEYGLSFNEASDQYHAVAKHLAANPVVPTLEQAEYEYDGFNGSHAATIQHCMAHWQSKMFEASR